MHLTGTSFNSVWQHFRLKWIMKHVHSDKVYWFAALLHSKWVTHSPSMFAYTIKWISKHLRICPCFALSCIPPRDRSVRDQRKTRGCGDWSQDQDWTSALPVLSSGVITWQSSVTRVSSIRLKLNTFAWKDFKSEPRIDKRMQTWEGSDESITTGPQHLSIMWPSLKLTMISGENSLSGVRIGPLAADNSVWRLQIRNTHTLKTDRKAILLDSALLSIRSWWAFDGNLTSIHAANGSLQRSIFIGGQLYCRLTRSISTRRMRLLPSSEIARETFWNILQTVALAPLFMIKKEIQMQQPQYNQKLEGNWCWPPSLSKSERSGPNSLQRAVHRAEENPAVKCFISHLF